MTEHDLGDLKLRTTESAEAVIVTWLGRSTASSPGEALSPPLLAAADRAALAKVGLVFAFEELEFFNSATITVLLKTIRAVRTRSVALTLRYDPSKRWQRMFFDAFAGVGVGEGDDVRLEAVRP